ncbi:carboxymuconolactone decarboxylase family protein, partial [Burkholderia cenocepacia]|nr:carboxymuconolactone decarboxylase family protein [Burkholderia cenocepacia]
MQPRLNFYAASPNAIKVMRNAEEFLAKSSIEKPLAELVRLRASQINGCA